MIGGVVGVGGWLGEWIEGMYAKGWSGIIRLSNEEGGEGESDLRKKGFERMDWRI